jgi:hypothetical protein
LKLVGIALLALGAVRLYVALKGSVTVPMIGGFQVNYQFDPPSTSSKLLTVGIIGSGLFLVLE